MNGEHLHQLKEKYFFQGERQAYKKGDFILSQGETNRSLYLILSGKLQVYTDEAIEQSDSEVFTASCGDILGIASFFSQTFSSRLNAIAVVPGEYLRFERDQLSSEDQLALEKDFMPLVVNMLGQRMHQVQNSLKEQASTQVKMQEVEKLASLGQLSAGVAHELNNAVAVTERGAQWIMEHMYDVLPDIPLCRIAFDKGISTGRSLSNAEIRRRSRWLQENYKFSRENAQVLARCEFTPEELNKNKKVIKKHFKVIARCYEIGATLYDIGISSKQSVHVVRSMKTLGMRNTDKNNPVEINDSIHQAMALLRGRLANIQVSPELNDLPIISGNVGDLVQIWTNLIKNAYDAMLEAGTEDPQIAIKSTASKTHITVVVKDNGPGIPQNMRESIFQPNVTTKVKGLSFGLGLGLAIVQRIVNEYGGSIRLSSSEKGTAFAVQIPILKPANT